MRLKFTRKHPWFMIVAAAIVINFIFAGSLAHAQIDTTYSHLFRSKTGKTYTRNPLHLVLPPLKPAVISTQKVSAYRSDDKLLNNVQVYPNPVSDQINVKYDLSRYALVTVKIVDVLGNDIKTIFSQRVDPGERVISYALSDKLNRGFYFVRIVAGNESVIKRISVL